jgi:hypothetical protein
MKRALKAKEKAKELLSENPWVNGVGITWDSKGHPIVKVNVNHQADEDVLEKIPNRVDGVEVVVDMVGDVLLE